MSVRIISIIIGVICLLLFAVTFLMARTFSGALFNQPGEVILLAVIISVFLLIVVGLICVFLPSKYWIEISKPIDYKYDLIIYIDLSMKENDENWIHLLDAQFEQIFKGNSKNWSYDGWIDEDVLRFIVYTNDLKPCQKMVDDYLSQYNLRYKQEVKKPLFGV